MNFSRLCKSWSLSAAAALALAVCAVPAANAAAERQNLVQLISSSQSIVAGHVTKVTDGIAANGIPYTEVTLAVGNSAKGNIAGGQTYTFRQFGLLKPRTLPNGQRMLMVTPEEFPRWHAGESVIAFLYHPASKTGLQTTSGLSQGKLTLVNDKLQNEFGNAGLFDKISVSKGALSTSEQSLIAKGGAVKGEDLMNLIRHIVKDQMIQRGLVK